MTLEKLFKIFKNYLILLPRTNSDSLKSFQIIGKTKTFLQFYVTSQPAVYLQ